MKRTDSVRIRPYLDSDHRGQVVKLWETVFAYDSPHNKPSLAIDKKIEVNDRLFFVAIKDASVVGTVMAGYDGHRGWIYSIAVAPSLRRQGIGAALMAVAEQTLKDKGCVKINLQILEGNESVTAFYSSLGFVVEKRISMGKKIPENVPKS
jgi:ribosomal protein S18 acetylase RimI-like enzyme